MNRSVGPIPQHPIRTTVVAALLGALLVFAGAGAAAAGEAQRIAGSPGTDARSSNSTPAPPPTPTPAPTPTPTSPPTPATGTTHEQQNGEKRVQRTDLGFLGVAFLFGIGFLLAAGALGVVVSGRARRRRDRATTDVEGASDDA
ncbi:MAG: hypothetical protein ACRDT7_04440 [Microbacterium sp.]